MDYTPNAKMMLGYIDDDDDDILDYDGNLDLSTDNEDEDEAETEIGFPQQYPETPDEKIHWQEQIRMIHLRSHLNQLMEKVRHAQYVTDKTREELKKCRGQIQQYEGERDRLFMEITTKESEGNQSAVYRIRAAHERICKELEAEQKLERMIIERLDHAEYELALAEVERGKFILAEDDLLQREHQLAKEKTDMAMVRLHKEEQLARQALITKRKDDRTRRDVRADEERRHIQAVEDAERSHERANKYLNRTLAKLRQRQDQEAERYKTDMTNKMDMLLKLKNDIAHNRENLRAIRARDKASENQKKSAEQAERESIAAEGGNPEEILLIKKRKNEMEKKKHHFEAQQKEKKAVIMQKILREEENIKKRRQQQPYLFDCPEREKSLRVAPLKKKPLKALENYMAATADEAEDVDNGAVDNKDREILKPLKKEKKVQSKRESVAKPEDETEHKEEEENKKEEEENEERVIEVKKEEEVTRKESFDSLSVDDDYKELLQKLSAEVQGKPYVSAASVKKQSPGPVINETQAAKKNKNKSNVEAEEVGDVEQGEEENVENQIGEGEDEEKLDQAEEERAMAEGGEGEDEFEREISLPVEERESDVSDVEDEGEVPVCLAKPEFEGLWNKETKPYRVPKDTDHLVSKPVGGSKMDKEILQKTLDKTRDGIVVTQVAAGREFTGCPFYSKPDVIHFKDFVVGKTYKKKVTLTNVSYTVNYIKYLDITEKLKDFIKIQFDPPGQMSAGLTCDMTVTFKPMINEDLKGQVNFLTQTGPFYIPLICSTKKCDLSLDVGCIDFGTTVIGETMKRSFTLTNHGALGTKFDFFKVTGMKPRTLTTAGTSLGRLDEPFSDAGLASKTQWKGLADRSGSIDSDSKWPSVCESKRPSTNDKTPSRRPSERYSDVNTPIERDVVSLQEGGAEEGAKQWLSQHNTPVTEVLPENDTRTDKDQTPKGGTSTFQSGQETPAAKDLTTDSMQAVSPDSAEAQEKSKQTGGSTSNVVDSKKKSEEALDKIPEARETTAPADGTGEVSVVESSEAADGNMGEVMAEGSDQKQDQDSDEATSPDLAVSEMEDYGSLDGMRVGPLVTGEIGPFSSLRLEIIWQPTIPGKVDSEFLVSFADPLSEQLTIHALANAIDVPVWVERQTVDLKICMFDRLYQDTITVNNRATTALRLKFEVCKELRNHLELLPKTGYIQAQSQFSAQLKFLPRQSLFEEAAKFFDPETGVLEAPMTIRVADQTTPVDFTVQAVVTNSDLEFDVSDIDFGYCTIHESVKKTIKLTNNSILPQQFGFVGLPEYVEVQPNDGFGTLLPLETVELDVIFSPRKTKEHKLDLVCRSLINRDFKISCKGVGVLTPLELSQQVIHFAATPLYDIASCAFHVVNSHTSSNEFTHPVPRIGKGEICPVGPTSFEFMVPKDAPITISPSVGTVEAGKKCRVQVRFTPTLNDYEIRQEALRIHTKMEAAKEEKERQEAALKEKQEKESNALKILLEEQNEALIKTKKPKAKNNKKNVNNNSEKSGVNETEKIHEQKQEILENRSSNKNISNSSYNEVTKISYSNKQKGIIRRKSRKTGNFSPDINACRIPIIERKISDQRGKNVFSSNEKYSDKNQNGRWGHTRCNQSEDCGSVGYRDEKQILQKNRKDKTSSLKDSNAFKAKEIVLQCSSRLQVDSRNNNAIYKEFNMNMNTQQEETDVKEGMEEEEDEQENLLENVDDGGKQEEEGGEEDQQEEDAQAGKGKGKGKSSPKGPQSKTSKLSAAPSSTGSAITQETTPRFDPDKISRDIRFWGFSSPEYQAAVTSLVRQFKGQFKTLTVPCYVASGATGNPGELSYSIHNTLYLEVHCPAIKPPVVVISDGGRRTVDFGDVSIGQTCPRSVTIQNISEKDLDLQATVTNPSGPFLMLNALRALSPGATHTILLTFSPLQGQVFQEELGIKTLNSTLHLTLKGHGVSPMVNLSVENEVFDMNSVLVGEFIEKTFKMENTSTLAIDFVIKQDSLSPLRHSKAQSIPPFLTSKESQKSKNYVGTQNANGKNVFDIVPTTGTIQAGESKEIMVTFAPDHASDLYSDGIRIELFDQEGLPRGQEESHFFQLIGQAKPRVMFLDGTDPLLPSLESLALQPSAPEEDESGVEHKIKKKPIGAESMSPPTLVTIKSVMKDDTFQPGVREIYAGCVRTMAVSQKKNGEFVIEGLQGLIQKGFTVEPQKGMVEAGTKKPIVFTWTPPQGYDPSNTIEETATLTLRCDVTEQITLMIRAMVVSE